MLFAAVLMLAALTITVPAGAETTPPALDIRVDLTRLEEGVVPVTLEVEVASSPLVLHLEDATGKGLEGALASLIEGERAFDEENRELPVTREGSTWTVSHAGRTIFTYQVRTDGNLPIPGQAGTSGPLSLNRLYLPYADGGLAYLPGYAIFLRPENPGAEKASLQVKLPPGWSTVYTGDNRPSDLESLSNNPLLAGDLEVLERGSFRLALALRVEPPEPALQEFQDKVEALTARLSSLLGGGEDRMGEEFLLLLLDGAGTEAAGGDFKPSASFPGGTVAVAVPDGELLSDRTLEAVSRGLASLALGRNLSLKEEAAWLIEGAAWYLQDILPYEAGIWGGALSWERLGLLYDAYREARSATGLSLAEAGSRGGEDAAAALLAYGGAMTCAALDAELRAGQPYPGNLFSFLQEAAGLKGGESPAGNEELRSLLETMTGRDWSVFFRQYVLGSAEVPLSSFSSLRIAPGEERPLTSQSPENQTSTSQWVLLGVAVALVLLVPFVLEPYTMRPRRPGFLEKKLRDED